MKVRVLWLGLLVGLLLWPASAVFAQGPTPGSDGGRVFWSEDVALTSGETFEGDLGIFQGNLDVPEGAVVNGSVFVTNGHVTIAGRVDGNVAVLGGFLDLAQTGLVRGDAMATGGLHKIAGQVRGNASFLFGDLALRSTALISGDLLVAPGHLQREAGSQVQGKVVTDVTASSLTHQTTPEGVPQAPLPTAVPSRPHSEPVAPRLGQVLGRILGVVFSSLVFVAVCVLVVLLWPRATRRVADCIAALPAQSLGLGLLTFLIAAGLEVVAVVALVLIILVGALLMATVVLIPVGLLLILLSWLILLPVPLAMVGGVVLGWVGLSELIGRKLLDALRAHNVAPLGSALLGLLITVSISAMLWILKPVCCAWPLVILLTSVGLGSVFHTRFGRQGCQPAGSTPPAAALPSDAMEEETGQPDTPSAETP